MSDERQSDEERQIRQALAMFLKGPKLDKAVLMVTMLLSRFVIEDRKKQEELREQKDVEYSKQIHPSTRSNRGHLRIVK